MDYIIDILKDSRSSEDIARIVQDKLAKKYGDEALHSWFRHLMFVGQLNGVVTLSVPSKFVKEWVQVNYSDAIYESWRSLDASVCAVEFCVRQEAKDEEKCTQDIKSEISENSRYGNSGYQQNHQRGLLYSPISNAMSFDNFVIGKSNEIAVAACQRVASMVCPDRMSNPLFIYGGVGLGKTHLMHAVAYHINTNMPWKQVVYLTAENFMRHFIRAIKDKSTRQLQDELRSADVLLIDDVQFIGGKEYTQEEFFHTFNDLIDNGKQLVISADRTPGELESVKDRIKSRLSGGLVVDICQTTLELRMGILQKKAEALKTELPYDVLEYLATHITSNVRELEGALNRLLVTANIKRSNAYMDLAVSVIRDTKIMHSNTITPDKINKIVSAFCGVKVSEIISPKKDTRIVKSRQIAMYLAKKLSSASLAEIGKSFGGRNHTTVMHAIKKVEENMDNEQFNDDIAKLIAKIHEQNR